MSATPLPYDLTVEDLGLLVNNDAAVEALVQSLQMGEEASEMVPMALEEVLVDAAWLRRIDRNGHPYNFAADRFEEFLTTPRPKGLGTTAEKVRRYLGDSGNPLRIRFEQLLAKPKGGLQAAGPEGRPRAADGTFIHNTHTVSIVDEATQPLKEPETYSQGLPASEPRRTLTGNSVGYATRALAKHRPDLLERVQAGEISAHAAMVKAGLRAKMIQVPIVPLAAARLLTRHFSREQFNEIVQAAPRAASRAASEA